MFIRKIEKVLCNANCSFIYKENDTSIANFAKDYSLKYISINKLFKVKGEKLDIGDIRVNFYLYGNREDKIEVFALK